MIATLAARLSYFVLGRSGTAPQHLPMTFKKLYDLLVHPLRLDKSQVVASLGDDLRFYLRRRIMKALHGLLRGIELFVFTY